MIHSPHLPPAPKRSALKAGIVNPSLWRSIRHSSSLQVLLLAAFVSCHAAAATVRAYLQPDHAQTGQVVNYVITVQNGSVQSVPQLRLPVQIGMTSAVSTAQNIEIRGAQQIISTQLSWGVAANEPGEFVIPPQEIQVNGETVKTNEVRLIVSEASTTGPAAAEDSSVPLLQIEVGKTEVYQGEVVPITASLFVPRNRVMLRRVGLIEVAKSDFAVARFPQQADQTMQRINDIDYMVVTYRSTLSALHAGDFKVGPASCELLFEVYDDRAQKQMRGLPFGLIMGGAETRKQVVKSQDVKIKVLPLPTEGKPANFSGAVGDFSISATATPNELSVGDPLAVDITIDGSGNFDALNPPSLTPPEGWKPYPPRRYNVDGPVDPNLAPTAQRRIGYSMVFVPEKVHAELPPFELSYFSPTQKKYVSARTSPIALRIKPGAAAATTATVADGGAESAPKPPAVLQPKPQMSDILMNVPAKARWLGPSVSGNASLTSSSRFWAIQSIPAALVILASLITWLRRRSAEARNGLRGELQLLWRGLEERDISDREFLHRAAHFIHRSQPGAVSDEGLRQIVQRYENQSFTAAPTAEAPLGTAERNRILSLLSPLLKRVSLMIVALAALSINAAAAEASPDTVYQQAREALEKGKYTQAQYLAETLTKQDPPALSAEVFTIIGHARYRQEDLGRAALWYQRAQLLEPLNPELLQNLMHLDEKLRFFRFGESSVLTFISLLLSKNTWIVIASASAWLVVLALVSWILSPTRKISHGVLVLIFTMLGLLIAAPAAGLAAIRPAPSERVKDIMVVTAREVNAYTAATVTSGNVISLPPGSQIRLLEKRGAWSYVEIPSSPQSVRGWVESATYTPLWPWDQMLVP